jgi:hypothetical protein
MQSFLSTWYWTVVAALLCIGPAFAVTLKMKSTKEQINSTIRSHEDLMIVKQIINLSMITSVAMVVEIVLCVCFLVYCCLSGRIPLSAVPGHLMVFSLVMFIATPYFKKTEGDFKKIKIESDDPEIAQTFQRWLIQWRQARLKLPD